MSLRIGITSGWEPGTIVEGWPLIYSNKGSIEAVIKAGAIPIIIPIMDDVTLINEYRDIVDGIIVAGEVLSIKRNVIKDGDSNVLKNSNPLRYRNEEAVIKMAIEADIPLLCICRGFQVLNVEQGGSMINEDINIGNEVMHQQGGVYAPNVPVHNIRIKPSTKLSNLLNVDQIMVNSFHRQAVDKVPEGYIISAIAPDGTIEAIESSNDSLILGVQFHPEMLREEIWTNFFKAFTNMILRKKQGQ